jgi:small subunit ribosomal protein S16
VPVKIRLRVVGKKKQHTYRIVAIESRNPRDGKYLEQLGWYNPRSKELQVDDEGIKRWQEKGAILTDAVKALLKRWRASKSEEVSDVEGTDNVHSEVSGGSAGGG